MARALRVSLLALLVFFVGLGALVPRIAVASSNPSFDAAWASCQQYGATYQANQYWRFDHCEIGPDNASVRAMCYYIPGGYTQHCGPDWGFTGTPPDLAAETCSGRPEIVLATDGGTTYSNAGCVYAPFGDTNHVTCIDNTGTHYCTGEVHMKPTGAYTQSSPPAAADPVPAPPKVCGGGSCYDPSAGQYCAVGEGGQVCVSTATAATGGCATTGDSTLCAGVLPPLPPKISIPDPATQIVSTDTYRNVSSYGTSSASTSFVTVNNYNTSGAPANSGKTASDTGPDNTPQDSGDKTTASGGATCTSPPLVEGNAAVAAVAQQVWLQRCQGDGVASNDADTTVPGIDHISESGQGLVADGGDIFSKLDFSGLAGGGPSTCPAPFTLQLARYGIDYEDTPEQWCDMLHAVGVMLEWFALVSALIILGRR